MESHLNRMRTCMREEGMVRFCCTDLSNVKWLTSFDKVFDDEPAHLAFVSDDEAVLHTDSRYADAACRAACGGPWSVDASGGFHARWIAEKLSRDGGKRLTIYRQFLPSRIPMSLAAFRRLEKSFEEKELPPAIETSDFVLKLRAVKDDVEIEAMKAAQAITDAAFEHIVSFMRVGMTEREVQLELEEAMRHLGAEGLAFSSIVASGANGAAPHSIPGGKVLERGTWSCSISRTQGRLLLRHDQDRLHGIRDRGGEARIRGRSHCERGGGAHASSRRYGRRGARAGGACP